MPRATANARRLSAAEIERGYFETAAAAAFTDLSPAYLRLLRSRGEGPPYYRLGRRVVYKREDLTEWVESFRVGAEA
jgi:hypothetical protein